MTLKGKRNKLSRWSTLDFSWFPTSDYITAAIRFQSKCILLANIRNGSLVNFSWRITSNGVHEVRFHDGAKGQSAVWHLQKLDSSNLWHRCVHRFVNMKSLTNNLINYFRSSLGNTQASYRQSLKEFGRVPDFWCTSCNTNMRQPPQSISFGDFPDFDFPQSQVIKAFKI